MKPKTDTRQHVLDTSRDVILGKGFAAVGLTELLAAAQVPKGSFYHYFKSKEDFGIALLEDYFDKYINHINEALAPDGRPGADRFMQFWSRWTDPDTPSANGARCLVVLLAAEVAELSDPMRAVLREGTHRLVARLAQCLM